MSCLVIPLTGRHFSHQDGVSWDALPRLVQHKAHMVPGLAINPSPLLRGVMSLNVILPGFFLCVCPGDCQVLSAGFYWSVIGHRDRQCQTLLVASLWINRRSRQLVTWEKKTKKILAGYFPSLFFVSLIFLDWHNRGIVEACMELWSVVVLSVQSFWHAVWE